MIACWAIFDKNNTLCKMIRDDIRNRIIFIDDDDINEWCVTPEFHLRDNANGNKYYDWSFTTDYEDALAAGTEFLVRDQNSRILKDQLIGYGSCTKPFCVSYDFENKCDEIRERCKQKAKEEKRKLKAKIEKHIIP